MDGFINSSIEKQTIYEIYRACRLCGAGAGYKMPIMQNVVHLDGAEVELRQKIRECVQIEVHQDDKMPPLICELCVDKVNDFYEFLEMCQQTNKRTRLRLGLPPQTMPKGAPDAGDCILGVTEPVYLNEDSNESLLKPKARNKGRFTKESQSIKKTNAKQHEVRSLRSKHISPPPQRASKRIREDDMCLSNIKKTSTRRSVTMPKSILRKENEFKVEDEWSPTSSKRSRDTTADTMKRVKIVDKPSPKSGFQCNTCRSQFSNNKALHNHMRIHNKPQPKYRSTPKQEKKATCLKCKKDFLTKQSLDSHKCAKTSGHKCEFCGRHISNLRNLASHERACRSRKEFKISPQLLKKLKPIQIRVKRCDPLLKKVGERYDVSGLDRNFGLDKNCIYPYLTSKRIKTEPSYMVNIHDPIDEFDLNPDYVHWDSDSHESDLEISDIREKNVGTLANLSLRTIFSHKFLGKVPKRKRRAKPGKAYDSILNFDSNVRLGIDNLINSLDNDRNVNDTKDNDNDSLFGDNKQPVISNDDFDSLFCSNNDSEISLNDKSIPNDGKCEIVHENNETENKKSEKSENINAINNENLTKLDCNDTLKNIQEDKSEEEESSEVVPGNVIISDVNNKVLNSEQDSIVKETEQSEKDSLINNKIIKHSEGKETEEIILKNNDVIDKVDTNDKELSNSINHIKVEQTEKEIESDETVVDNDENVIENDEDVIKKDEKVIENDEFVVNEIKISIVKINDNNRESNIRVNESDISVNEPPNTKLSGVNDDKNKDSSAHNNDIALNEIAVNNENKIKTENINGGDKLDLDDLEDISESEIDDSRLMNAINEQLGEKREDDKSDENERDSVSVVNSADLESISSEELPNE